MFSSLSNIISLLLTIFKQFRIITTENSNKNKHQTYFFINFFYNLYVNTKKPIQKNVLVLLYRLRKFTNNQKMFFFRLFVSKP